MVVNGLSVTGEADGEKGVSWDLCIRLQAFKTVFKDHCPWSKIEKPLSLFCTAVELCSQET